MCSKEFEVLGRKIAYYRRLKHLSQDQLAKQIGISTSYLSKIERADVGSISLATLIQIAAGLELQVHMLLKPEEHEILFNKKPESPPFEEK
jgi:transcriptional regulator with XRE-family HTH domain